MDTWDLLLHPVRLRLVWALSGGRISTTGELCDRLPDVPKTTLYRQVALLAAGGILEVAGEHRVRGAVERSFRLRLDRAAVPAEAGASMSVEDHRRGFTAAVAALLAEFGAYLDRPGVDPYADQVGYRDGVVWMSDGEVRAAYAEISGVIAANSGDGPGEGRRPRVLSIIQFPATEAPGEDID